MCSVFGCYSGRRTAERFKLPEDPEERLEWVVFLAKANKQRFKESSWTEISVCSEHFTEDCFVHGADPVQLKPGSVPSVCCAPDDPVMSSICEISVGNTEVVHLSDQAKIQIGATSCLEESVQTLLGSHNGPVSARASCSSDSSVCFQPKPKTVDMDLIKKKVALLKTKGKFPVNEKHLVQLFSRICPSCGGKLKMHKASRGVVIILHQLCLQCDYTYEWKSLVDGNVPAEDGHRTGSSKAAAADETSSSVSELPEIAAVMNEESDPEDEPEESSDPGDVDSDEDWKPAAGAFTGELFPAKRNEEVAERADYSGHLETAPPYNRLCTDCGTFFDRRTPHVCSHKVKPYSCNICGKRFVSKVALNHHNEIHNENYGFSCKFCHVSFKAKADKFAHEQIHIAEGNSYKCPDCSRTFATNKERRIHLEEHKMQNQVKCHFCEMEFVSLSSLQKHLAVHTGAKQFACFVCQRAFNRKEHLKTHMRLHTGERPYKCQLCDKCFAHSGSLKLHVQRCHTFSSRPELERSNEQEHDSDARANGGETGGDFGFDIIKEEQDANDVQMDQGCLPKTKNQVKCHLCEMEFVMLSSLQKHLAVHAGAKQFACFVCQRAFNQKGHLKTHMRLHTGERPYKCQLCDTCFTHSGSLKLHVQRYHTVSSRPELERSNEQEHDSDARANGGETGGDFGFDSIKKEQDANGVQMDQRRLPKTKKKSSSGSKGRPGNSGSRNIIVEDDAKDHGSDIIRRKAHVKKQKMTDEDSKNTPSDSNVSVDSSEEKEMWTTNMETQTRGANPDMKVCSRNKSGKCKGRPRKNWM